MRTSKGGLTHDQIMKLTWRQFGVYLDAFTWLLREESEEGRKKNRVDDFKSQAGDPNVRNWKQRLVDEANRRLAPMRARMLKSDVNGQQ